MEPTDTDIRFAEKQINLACFEVNGRPCAINVAQVKEIVRCQEVTPFPNAPKLIEGVIDLRGVVIPVIDLGRALAGEPVDATEPRARIVIVEAYSLVLGLRVAAALDVLSLPTEALENPPALAIHAGYDAVCGVVRRNDSSPIVVLSLDHILERVYSASSSTGPLVSPECKVASTDAERELA